MEKKFIVPAYTFIVAFLLWIAFFIVNLYTDMITHGWINTSLCLLVAALVVLSGLKCKAVGGPRMGSFVRGGILLLFAVLTYLKIELHGAAILLLGSIFLFVLGFMTKCQGVGSKA